MNVIDARYCTLWLVSLLLTISCAGGGNGLGIGPTPTPSTTVLLAAGDIGVCGSTHSVETGQMLDSLDGTILAVGDLAYRHGTAQEFASCYDPVWGRHKARTRPSPGNHEYETADAQPYFDYFGDQAGPPGRGYFSFQAGAWLVLSLNSNVPVGGETAQTQWIREKLRTNQSLCTLAYFHHPLYSSGPNGDNAKVAGLWQLLYENGVDVVLGAHEHFYERFAPMSPDGQRNDTRGMRQFIVGTGGAGLYALIRQHPQSEVRVVSNGILRLTLGTIGYSWEFLQPAGVRGDVGTDICH